MNDVDSGREVHKGHSLVFLVFCLRWFTQTKYVYVCLHFAPRWPLLCVPAPTHATLLVCTPVFNVGQCRGFYGGL